LSTATYRWEPFCLTLLGYSKIQTKVAPTALESTLLELVLVFFGFSQAQVEFSAELTVEVLQILHRDADQGAGFHFTFFTLGSHDSHGYEGVFVRVFQKILLARFEFQQVSFGKRSGRT